jgi:selenocysteine-specific elongation factor
VVNERGWVDVDHLERLTGQRLAPTVGTWAVAPSVVDAYKRVGGLSALTGWAEKPPVALGRALVAAFAPPEAGDNVGAHPYLAALRAELFAPPAADGVAGDVLRRLREAGLAVERDGVWFAAEAVAFAGEIVARLLAASPAGVTVTAVRTELDTTRKYIVPLLNHLDAVGVTRRRGDLRVGGPRLPAAK